MFNFFNVARSVNGFRRGYVTDPFDEPTYLSFGIDFSFSGLDLGTVNSLWASPLFAEGRKTNPNSASSYLGSIGRNDMEDALTTFKGSLDYISTKTPWYFQSIKGLDTMYKAATDMNSVKKYDQILTIETLEAVDLRISQLANLYRAAIYDKEAMLARVPENLRWFAMEVWVAETRNMRFEIPGIAGNAANALGINTAAINGAAGKISSSLSGLGLMDDENSTIKQFGFMKFKCRQCEFDFSDSFAGAQAGAAMEVATKSTPNTSRFDIKVGYFEEESGYYDGTKLYDDATKNRVNNPWRQAKILATGAGVLNSVVGLPFVGNTAAKGIEAVSNGLKNIGGLTNKVTDPITNLLYAPVKDLGDVYPDKQKPSSPTNLGDVYD